MSVVALKSGATLVLGGARSGKSVFAEKLVMSLGQTCHYIATAEIFDQEMSDRVDIHQKRRGELWQTHEEPLEILDCLRTLPDDGTPVLVDCLTLWLSNLMHQQRDLSLEKDALCSGLLQIARPVVLVSNEVGLGIVPENAMARRFRDEAGRLHQAIAQIAKAVYFIAAGLPLKMK